MDTAIYMCSIQCIHNRLGRNMCFSETATTTNERNIVSMENFFFSILKSEFKFKTLKNQTITQFQFGPPRRSSLDFKNAFLSISTIPFLKSMYLYILNKSSWFNLLCYAKAY